MFDIVPGVGDQVFQRYISMLEVCWKAWSWTDGVPPNIYSGSPVMEIQQHQEQSNLKIVYNNECKKSTLQKT